MTSWRYHCTFQAWLVVSSIKHSSHKKGPQKPNLPGSCRFATVFGVATVAVRQSGFQISTCYCTVLMYTHTQHMQYGFSQQQVAHVEIGRWQPDFQVMVISHPSKKIAILPDVCDHLMFTLAEVYKKKLPSPSGSTKIYCVWVDNQGHFVLCWRLWGSRVDL